MLKVWLKAKKESRLILRSMLRLHDRDTKLKLRDHSIIIAFLLKHKPYQTCNHFDGLIKYFLIQ